MRVMITGADGYIGRHATRGFSDAGWQVTGVGLAEPSAETPVDDWIVSDLAVAAPDAAAFAGVDVVVHLAAIPGRLADDGEVFRNNVCGTFNLLEAAGGAGVRRAVIASSISAYGLVWPDRRVAPPELPLTERSELRPAESYALSKQVDEATARAMSRRHGLSVAALRFPLVQSETDIRARAEEVLADRSVGERELWAYLTFEDAARAMIAAATAPFDGVLVANIVSPEALGGIDAIEEGARVFPEARRDPAASGAGYAVDVAREVLGFEATRLFRS